MKLALPVLLICGALLAALAVLGAGGRAAESDAPFPDLTLRDPGGGRVDTARFEGRLWVASFVDDRCLDACPATLERLARLADGLPDEIRLVTFVLGGDSLWPSPVEAAEDRDDWLVCQGNEVDADGDPRLRNAAERFFRVPEQGVNGLAAGEPAAWVVVVDAQGRPLEPLALDEAPSADAAVAAVWGDVEFRVALAPAPGRDARLFALTAVLLLVGVALARLELVKVHPVFTGGATLVTMISVGFAFQYVDLALSVPSRGTGWARPVYFAVLTTHAALCALMVVLAWTLVYCATRGQLDRHRALARWIAPAWISVALTGTAIYLLTGSWFPAG